MFLSTLLIAAGGAIGSVARFWLNEIILKVWGGDFPWGTIIANISGSLLIGAIAALPAFGERDLLTRQFLMVGIMGGYTTFSSFSLQTLTMLQNGHLGKAAVNVAGSVVLCLVAVWAGYALAASVTGSRP
ncbi:MAG TPA: fluoride efflux transporter CrcB [Dongiaceae bacterium]|nr:fluoride efflux transporter CrcB [Dongiaceae bacterium]